jgi:ABC-type nitrate/sulfonate/bicarbonate transport system permease component
MTGTNDIERIDAVPETERGGGARRRAPKGSGRLLTRVGLFALAVAILVLAWILGAAHYPDYILPGPGPVWDSFTSNWDRGVWISDVEATLGHLFTAYALTIALGLPIGILIGRFWVVEDLTRAFLIFLQTVPTVVLIVLALVFVGTTASAVVTVTVASCFTYFTLNVIQGTKAIDGELVEMARTYEANELTIMRSIIVPSVVPYFLAGARITLGVAWQVTLFGEYLMGIHGIGFQISGAIGLLNTPDIYMWGLSVVLLTIAFEYGFFRPLEWLLTRNARRAT